jgi:hypothetical protein
MYIVQFSDHQIMWHLSLLSLFEKSLSLYQSMIYHDVFEKKISKIQILNKWFWFSYLSISNQVIIALLLNLSLFLNWVILFLFLLTGDVHSRTKEEVVTKSEIYTNSLFFTTSSFVLECTCTHNMHFIKYHKIQ